MGTSKAARSRSTTALPRRAALNASSSRSDLGRGFHVGVDRDADQWQPCLELRCDHLDGATERVCSLLAGRRGIDADRLAYQRTDHGVGNRRRVLVGRRDEHPMVARAVPQLVNEPRLPHAGLGGDLDQPPAPGSDGRERVEKPLELSFAAEQRRPRGLVDVARSDRRSDGERGDRRGLPLHLEGRELRHGEDRPRPFHDVGHGDHLSRLGLRRQPSREVHGIAHDRVLPSVRRPDQSGEHRSLVHTDPNRERRLRLDDLSRGPEQLLLVVLAPPRRSRREHELAAAQFGIAIEERDEVARRRRLHDVHELGQASGGHLTAFALEGLIEPVEADERDRDPPVLGIDDGGCDPLDLRSHERCGIDVAGDQRVDVDEGGGGHANQQPATVASLSEHRRRKPCGRRVADHDLAGDGAGFHLDGLRRRGTGHHELPMDGSEQEEIERSAVDADVHLQRRRAGRRLHAADVSQFATHARRRVGRPPGMF